MTKLFSRFVRDCKASAAPMLAVGIIPLFGAVGVAVDYSRANSARAAMQAALDATALSLVKDNQVAQSALINSATDQFNANLNRPEVENIAVTAQVSARTAGTSLSMSATATIKTEFLRTLGYSKLALSVNSAAAAESDGLGCVLSLAPTASSAVKAQGTTSVELSNCSLYDNSSNSTALAAGGSARISALSIGVVGGISGVDSIVTTQGVRTGIGPVPDPYADVAFPNFTTCSNHNFTAKSTMRIDPGVFCGGIGVNAGAELTLNPGIYYLDGGGLSVNGGAALIGNNVTLVFTSKNRNGWADATINGNAIVNLTPPSSGPTAGIVVFGDRNIPLGTTFKFNGGASQYLGGAIYIPTGDITFSGGAGTSTSCTQIIGYTMTFVGNSDLAINCSSYKTKPFSATVIKVTS